MQTLVIVGAGGHGKVCAELAEDLGRWDRICFLDGRYPELSKTGAWDVIGQDSALDDFTRNDTDVFVAIGNNHTRARIIKQLLNEGWQLATLLAPGASISAQATIGPGSVVLPQAVVAYDAELGSGCIVNHGATVDHDCILGACVHVAPGANISGETSIGDQAWIGTGASVLQCLSIGENVTVAAGAAVVTDLANEVTVGGVPARPLTKES